MENSSTSPTKKIVFSIRLFPEITIKSAPIRKRWTKLLAQNLRTLSRQIDERASVAQDWDRLELRVPADSEETRLAIIDLLARVPGIANYSQVESYAFESMDDILEKTLALWAERLVNKTFCVRVKRAGSHDFASTEVERYIGGGLNQHIASASVKLKRPDETVRIEIKDDIFYLARARFEGLGGFPLGTQDPVLSLVSGGFDSTVASYQMIARGMRTHFCFFNLGGSAHETGVKEISYYLWRKYGGSHRVKFVTVPFQEVVGEIMENVSPANMGVVLKRMMFRAAEAVAEKTGIQALVTGEAISQVSSQTIPNLAAIDRVTELLVLRPLIAMAKPEIIRSARAIGCEEFAANIPEYCGVISVKPSACVDLSRLEAEELNINPEVLQHAIASCTVQSIDRVMEKREDAQEVGRYATVPSGGIVIDIRHPDEVDLRRLAVVGHDILTIPFYKLDNEFEKLAPEAQYFLYCDKGVMSELHALHLKERGFENVAVYRPGST